MYKTTDQHSITRLSDGASVPNDPANTDYITYLKWLSEGNTPQPVDPPDFNLQKATQFTEFNDERTKFLDALTGIAGRAARAGDTITSTACDKVAEGLLVLKDQPEVIAATDLTSLKQAMLICYSRLLTDVPLSVKLVFSKAKS